MPTLTIKALKHQKQLIKCSLSDHFLFRTPVSVAFFYRKSISYDLIIKSLQHVLSDFPIFAGRLIKQNRQLYINCNNQGVKLSIVNSKSMLQNLNNFKKNNFKIFIDAINPNKVLKKCAPVLTIKLSYHLDGMVIGYCWHHSIGDMSTFMSFLKALSSFAKNKTYDLPLILDDQTTFMKKCISKKKQSSRFKLLNFIDIFRIVKYVCSPKKGIYIYLTEDEVNKLKNNISEQTGCRLSRNDVICSHLLNTLASCRNDNEVELYASIAVNLRSKINLPSNILGNCIDTIPVNFKQPYLVTNLAKSINLSVKNYINNKFDPNNALEFIEKNGGIKNVGKIIPKEFLPKYKNLIITNWTNFGVYSIDFGVAIPYLFLPVGKAPLPWVSGIVEGFNNKGLLIALILPSKVTKCLKDSATLAQFHSYRSKLSKEEASIVSKNKWCN